MMKTYTLIKVFALISFALFLSACESEKVTSQEPLAPEVSVAQVIYERLTEWDTFTGRLEAPQTVNLKPRISGYIESVVFEEGQIVKAGDTLFKIDDRAFKAEVERYEAEWSAATARFELAESEYKRAQNLITKNAISTEVLDNRRANMLAARASANSVKAALELAKLQLSFTEVEAPITGRVSRALVTEGNYVTAGQSDLTSLVSTGEIYAYFDADEQTYLKYVALKKEGSRPSSREHANLILMGLADDQDYPHQGYIDYVDNQINPNTGTIRGRAVFENLEGDFIPGLFARIKLIGSASYSGILIDDKAIGSDLNNKYVLVLNDENVVEYRAVILGEKVQDLRIVKSGLNANEKIVVNGLQRVRPGTAVTPIVVDMTSSENLHALQETQLKIDENVSPQQFVKNADTQSAVVGG